MALGLVLIIAAGLRLYDLGSEGFHVDDFRVIHEAGLPLWDLFKWLARDSFLVPPLSYLVLKFARLFSDSELVARLPSALASIVGIGLTYALGRRLFNPTVGLIAAILLAIAPSDIRYAQDVRFWSQFSAVHLATFLCLVWALQRDSRRLWIVYGLITVIALYLNVLSLIALALQAGLILLFLAAKYRYRFELVSLPISPQRARKFAVSASAAALAFLPWGIFVAIEWLPREVEGERFYIGRGYDLQPDPLYLHETLSWLVANQSNGGLLVLLVAAFIAVALIASYRRRQLEPILLAAYVLAFVSLLAVLSIWLRTFLATRRIVFVLPFISILVAVGISAAATWLSSRRIWGSLFQSWKSLEHGALLRRLALLVCLVIVALSSLGPILDYYASERTNYKGAAQLLDSQVMPDDLIVLGPRFPEFHGVVQYYLEADRTGSVTLDNFDYLSEGREQVLTLDDFTMGKRWLESTTSSQQSLRIWWVTDFPPSGEDYYVYSFNTPGKEQYIAGARGVSDFKMSVFVARQEIPPTLRAAKEAALSLVFQQVRTEYPILPGERLKALYAERRLEKEIAALDLLEEMGLGDGSLIKGSRPAIWVLDGGLRRPIPSLRVLEACGYKRSEIKVIDDDVLRHITGGKRLTGPPCPKAAATPTPAQPTPTPAPPQPLVHIVQEGDTLWTIAEEYDVSVDALLAANDIEDPSLLQIGQEIRIPR